MSMIRGIHHINFLVRDLDSAIDRYRSFLQCGQVIREDLPQRGVLTARFKIGETWIVLVQPLDSGKLPGRYLEEHGEGFFLISYKVDDLVAASENARKAGVELLDRTARQGLADWRVMDLSADDLFAVNTQLVESAD